MDNQVTVQEIVENAFRPGEKQAMIRMEVTTGAVGNNLKDSLYGFEELGRQTFVEKRVDWLDVPKDATVESVQKLINTFPNARIYKILSNEPILSDSQDRVIKNGLSGDAFEDFKSQHGIEAEEWNIECATKLLKVIAEAQTVRYGEDSLDGTPGDPILYKGKKQYRVTYFSKDGQKDIDRRTGSAILVDLALADNPAAVPAEVTTPQ